MKMRPLDFAAFAWGFAEATLFFIVPDVLITYLVATKGLVPALKACFFTLAGALLGGMVMFLWAIKDPAQVITVLGQVPAIGNDMINGVGEALRRDGLDALYAGAISGRPYKIYAVQAAIQNFPPLAFVTMSIPARLFRWLALTVVVWMIGKVLSTFGSPALARNTLIACWIVFYVVYWVAVQG